MTNREIYCLYRARQLNEQRGISLVQGWAKAEAEWAAGECIPQDIDPRDCAQEEDDE